MLNHQYKKLSFDLGYNLYARTCENFGSPREYAQCCPNLCDGNRDQWALKGDAHVFGFLSVDTGVLSAPGPITLSATQCGATIHRGTNAPVDADDPDCAGISTNINCGVDNPAFAYAQDVVGDAAVRLLHAPGVDNTEGNHIKTSVEPLFINCCDINLQRTRGISHKIFGHANYTWEKNSFTPYLGIGGFAEFGRNDDLCCTPLTVNCEQDCDNTSCEPQCCTDCLDCSLSQWGVWIKGGINFESICG